MHHGQSGGEAKNLKEQNGVINFDEIGGNMQYASLA